MGALVFAGPSINGKTLAVDNWTGTAATEGISGTNDRLLVDQLISATDLAGITFTGFRPGAQEIALTGGYYELVPVPAVPEPSTWSMVGVGAAGLGLTLRQRRGACRA